MSFLWKKIYLLTNLKVILTNIKKFTIIELLRIFVIATCTVTEIFLTMLQLHCGDRLQHPAHCGAQLPQPQAEDIPEVPEIIMKNWPLVSIADPIKMCWILLDPLLTQFSTHKTKKNLKKLLNQYL